MIKKKISLLFISMLLLPYIKAQITYTADFNIDHLIIKEVKGDDGHPYTVIAYKELSSDNTPGQPELPVKYLSFSVPTHVSEFNISINNIVKETITVDHMIFPCQLPVPPSMVQQPVEFIIPDPNIYNTSDMYPSTYVKVVHDGFLDGDKHIATLAIHPVSYHPEKREIEFISSLSFTIDYPPSTLAKTTSETSNIIKRKNVIANEDNSIIDIVKSLVINPQDVDKNTQLSVQSPVSSYAAQDIGIPYYQYCVITTRSLSKSFERLVAWKRQKGITAGIVCVEDILSNANIKGDLVSNLTDNAGKIRGYLTYAYEAGTQYVLFGGNDKILPIRHGTGSTNSWMQDNNPIGGKIPTDLYFSDLNGNWNVDGDQYLGEQAQDKVDYYPELYVGRILCNNSQEADNYITKLIKYELNPGYGNSSYLKKSFHSQSDQLQRDKQAQKIIEAGKSIFTTNTLFEEIPSYDDPNPTFPKGKEVVQELNKRYHFIGLYGHAGVEGINTSAGGVNSGPRYFLSTYNSYQNSGAYVTEDGNGLDNLTNQNYPAIMYSVGCGQTPFDNYNGNSQPLPTHNFGESFTSKGLYGGPAFLGNTRVGWVSYSQHFMEGFMKKIVQGYRKVGVAEALSRSEAYSGVPTYYRHWVALTHNLIGCPEFEMWTTTPAKYTTISISGTNASPTINTGVASSIITAKGIFGGNNILKKSTSTSSTFSGMPTNYIVTVYKYDRLPYIAPLYAQNENVTGYHYLHVGEIHMGRSVTSNKTQGDLVIKKGAEVIIEKSGMLVLDGGFEVEYGAAFQTKELF